MTISIVLKRINHGLLDFFIFDRTVLQLIVIYEPSARRHFSGII
jgi:hypothetical protein